MSTCPYCKKAKSLLSDLGANFETIHVDLLPKGEQNAILDTVRQLADKCKPRVDPIFPIIVRNKDILIGFNETKLKRMAFKPNSMNLFFRF